MKKKPFEHDKPGTTNEIVEGDGIELPPSPPLPSLGPGGVQRLATAILRAHHPEVVEGDTSPYQERAREYNEVFNEIMAILQEQETGAGPFD